MSAKEFYYNAVVRKSQKDSRNPYAEAAAAGITRGVQGALDTNNEMKKGAGKFQMDSILDSRKQRQTMAAKVLETYGIFDKNDKPDNSIASRNAVYQALVDGSDTFPNGLSVKPLKEQRTYQTPEEIAEQNRLDRESRERAAGMRGGGDGYEATETTENQDEQGNTIKTVQKGYMDEVDIPEVPAVDDRYLSDMLPVPIPKIFNVRIKKGEEAIPASKGQRFVPGTKPRTPSQPMQQPTRPPVQQAPIQPQAPQSQLPVEKVKEIGNAALKAHYKHTAINPKTNERVYSDDGLTWIDEKGNPIQ